MERGLQTLPHALNKIVENLQRSIEIMKTPEQPKESMILLKDRWLTA